MLPLLLLLLCGLCASRKWQICACQGQCSVSDHNLINEECTFVICNGCEHILPVSGQSHCKAKFITFTYRNRSFLFQPHTHSFLWEIEEENEMHRTILHMMQNENDVWTTLCQPKIPGDENEREEMLTTAAVTEAKAETMLAVAATTAAAAH